MYTKQDLVNACLHAISNDSVSALEDRDVDTDVALTYVNSAIVDLLSQGWWFNTEDKWKLPLNDNNEVELPKGVLSFRSTGLTSSAELVKRSGHIYDKRNHTFDLSRYAGNSNSIEVSCIMLLELEDCPVAAQQLIRQRAIVNFMGYAEVDLNKVQVAQQREMPFLAILEKHEHRNAKRNAYDSPQVRQQLGMMGGNRIFNPIRYGDDS